MIPFYVYFVTAILLMLMNYFIMIKHLRTLRNELTTKYKPWEIVVCGAFFGGPILLLSYMFKEIRDEDIGLKRIYLISGIIETALQILLTVLLCVFNVLTF